MESHQTGSTSPAPVDFASLSSFGRLVATPERKAQQATHWRKTDQTPQHRLDPVAPFVLYRESLIFRRAAGPIGNY